MSEPNFATTVVRPSCLAPTLSPSSTWATLASLTANCRPSSGVSTRTWPPLLAVTSYASAWPLLIVVWAGRICRSVQGSLVTRHRRVPLELVAPVHFHGGLADGHALDPVAAGQGDRRGILPARRRASDRAAGTTRGCRRGPCRGSASGCCRRPPTAWGRRYTSVSSSLLTVT